MNELILKEFDNYKNKFITSIGNQIDELGNEIVNTSKNDFLNMIYDQIEYIKLSVLRENINIEITKSEVSGRYFDPGYDIDRSKTYLKDFVLYEIPILNGDHMFFSTDNLIKSHVDSVTLYENTLKIELCSYENNVATNEIKLEELKKKALSIINVVESSLMEINNKQIEFKNNLNNIVNELFNNKLINTKQNKSALNKLNPYL